MIQLGGSAATVFAADPKVAEVRPASATSLFIFGVAPGRTTVAALNASGGPIAQYDVVVRPSSYGANEAEAAVARALPGSSVHVETLQNGLTVTGQVKTPSDADRVMQIVRGYLPSGQSVDNRLSVASVRAGEPARAHRGDEPQPGPPVGRELGQALGNIGTDRQVSGVPLP